MNLKIILVDDHKIVRHGLKAAFENESDMVVVGEAEDGRSAISLTRDIQPDVVLMDVSMPDLNGIEATRQILSEAPSCKVIGLSMHSHGRYVMGMLEAGAAGFLLKTCSFDELKRAVRSVASGKTFLSADIASLVVDAAITPNRGKEPVLATDLTPREREVLQLIAEGCTTREIAEKLHVSVKTVETHRRQIMNKLNLRSIAQLTKYAVREGLTSL